jgi:hypothetical protein
MAAFGGLRCQRPATQVHHKNRRYNKLLLDVEHFMAICHECHQYLEANGKEARRLGYLK